MLNYCRFGGNDKNATIVVGSGEMIKIAKLLQVRGNDKNATIIVGSGK